MSDDEHTFVDLSGPEERLERQLARLGPAMWAQEQFEAEMDPVFARTLRAHLVLGESQSPRSWFARTVRGRRVRERTARPLPKLPLARPVVWISAAATALLALLIGLLVAVPGYQHTHVASFSAPYPSREDLVFSFPAPPMVIHRLAPTVSLVHPRPGVPYAGHLRLSAGRLPQRAPSLRAYRLASPPNVIIIGRRLLGIRTPVRHEVVGSATWAVAADGGFPSRRPLHSLAVSLVTGEMIYHDRRNRALTRARRALARSAAVTVARHWLARLGWPGKRMPLIAVESVPNVPKVREVELGWIGVGATATDAATLWVTPNKSVIEAWVWPPVVRGGSVPSRPVSAAWTDVQTGKLPLAVEGVPPTIKSTGSGALRQTTVVAVLASGGRRALYLVPTYRFEGKAHIVGASVHTWYTLAPGAKK